MQIFVSGAAAASRRCLFAAAAPARECHGLGSALCVGGLYRKGKNQTCTNILYAHTHISTHACTPFTCHSLLAAAEPAHERHGLGSALCIGGLHRKGKRQAHAHASILCIYSHSTHARTPFTCHSKKMCTR